MFFSVNFSRSLPASFILKISATMFIDKHIEKTASLSFQVLDNDFAAAANQSAITAGFSVFIKKPVMKSLM